MPSKEPQDFGAVLLPPLDAAQVQRVSVNVGQWTANSTVASLVHVFDRPAVIREVWFAADAVPNDADGAMTIDVDVRDASEDAFDSIVAAFDAEGLTTAFEGAEATLAAETSENERTVAAGDSLRVELVSDSAAIDTNANVVVTVLFQVIESL